MTTLTPLAVQNADVLRALAAGGFGAVADLARKLGKPASNLKRSLKSLDEAGLVGFDDAAAAALPVLKATGHDAVAALDRAEGAVDAAAIEGMVALLHAQIRPDPNNPRKHFDPEALAELAASIAQDDLLENLVVRAANPGDVLHHPDGDLPIHFLAAGERRWRAIGLLIQDGRWEPDRPIVCKVKDMDEATHRRIALVENLQRKDLRPIDEAEALKALMEVSEQGTAEIAKEIGFTQRFVQQRLQLLELPERLRDEVNDGSLPIEKARAAIAILPKLSAQVRQQVESGQRSVDSAKEWLDGQPKTPDLTPAQWLMALEIYDAIQRRPMKKAAYEYDRTEVAAAAKEDGQLEQLRNRGLVSAPTDQTDNALYLPTGRRFVSLAWKSLDYLVMRFGEDLRGAELEERLELLGAARVAASVDGAVDKGTPYHTAWLNPPFEIDQAAAAKHARAVAKRKKEQGEEKARKARAAEEDARRQEEAQDNAIVVQQLLESLAARPPGACDSRFADALAKAGLPTPWRMDQFAAIRSANEREILWRSWSLDREPWILAQRALLVAAVNLAAGATFTVQPDAPATADDSDPEGGDGAVEPETSAVQFLDDDEDLPEFLTRLTGPSAAGANP